MKIGCHYTMLLSSEAAIKYKYYDIDMPRCKVCGSEMEEV